MKEKSIVESVSGSLATVAGLTVTASAVGAVTSGPMACVVPLLPLLASSLAHSRQEERLNQEIEKLNSILAAHEDKIKNLSDSQYKIANEIVLTVMNTIDADKLLCLRTILSRTLTYKDIAAHESDQLSRIIRDVSASELDFLKNNFSYQTIGVSSQAGGDGGNVGSTDYLSISEKSKEYSYVCDLANVGVLNAYDGFGGIKYVFSPIAAKLLLLLGRKE